MEQNEENLYKLLCALKSKLQQKFYADSNNRKPTICTDDALKLIAKYKPQTIEDMKNINGIGENFIANYGIYFLTAIKKFNETETTEINEKELEILSKLENRLVHINKRNRLLYSSKINKDYGIDLFKLVDNITDLERFILDRESQSFKIIDIKDFEDTKLQALLRIIRQNIKNEIETGNDELYIAYPFVEGKTENENFNIKAPLILFPIKLERNATSILLKNDNQRDIIYNTNLILANNKFNKKNEVLPDNAIEEFHKESYIEDMIDFYSQNEFYIQFENSNIEKFRENKLNEFPNYKNGELKIKKYIVLGLYSTYVTSMYADFHRMIQEKNTTNLIKDLLWGIEGAQKEFDIVYDEDEKNENLKKTIENEIIYINELDFSQEKVLKMINEENSLVIQGPPGTGKSQTITSIIAQSVLQKKNVLMVSEKKTALDVIYSRLGNLSKFALIIDDIENKSEFYNQINSIINEMNSTNEFSYIPNVSETTTVERINENIQQINADLECLECIAKKIYSINSYETSMFKIYNTCKRIDLTNEKEITIYNYINAILTENIKKLTFPVLTKIHELFKEQGIANSIELYLNIVKNNPVLNTIKPNLVDIELVNFKNQLTELEEFITNFNTLPFYKKIFQKKKLDELITRIIDNYFTSNNKTLAKYLITNINNIKNFINIYRDFISNKYLYDKLNFQEKEYVNLIINVKDNLHITFQEGNNQIYNTILYNIIIEFEKNNPNVLSYINNFDSIRDNIRKNIISKKELTQKLAFNQLLKDIKKLNDNNNLNKIEEMCNRKRKMSINKFMSKYKLEMLDSIKIWLMTPEVVSDILPFEKNTFDIVIFDEASQLYVEKSIPSIYRAKKVIIAGDQKQLKPSSLGQGRILDEIDEEEITDGFLEYESLLDAAKYKYKSTMLNYHYRSKYEELIAFSNYAFYDGKLMIISNANRTDEKPIERIKIENGQWINKQNEQEAQTVIKLIKNILITRKNNETIGVITFNVSQMNLIEDLIEKEKNLDSNFATLMLAEENRFTNGENISFFVKNIEAVQGDERDIIIFCIGYAKNEVGRVAINFGWLNQDGGENRLNVAISRAKEKIFVVTSIEPEELLVDSTKNNGPKLFKQYLEYVKAIDARNNELAESILLSLADRNTQEQNQIIFDSEFEEEVYKKLIERGYNVKTQYGVGGYRIDLVIQGQSEENILGIECDGRLYHSAKSARERDYHRQKYLESRGWKIYRIWSTNWWRNPDLEIQKLENYIKKIESLNSNK